MKPQDRDIYNMMLAVKGQVMSKITYKIPTEKRRILLKNPMVVQALDRLDPEKSPLPSSTDEVYQIWEETNLALYNAENSLLIQ
jgi:hypothetical protein